MKRLKGMFANRHKIALRYVELAFGKKLLPPKLFIKITYRLRINKSLDLKKPQTFSEKLQWLKLYDKKDVYKTFVDKLSVRDYVEKKIGKEHLIPLLGVWERPEEIDFNSLPDNFMLKCNYGSGLNQFTFKIDKTTDKEYVAYRLRRALEKDYYYHAAEWPYRDINKKIIAEEMIDSPDGEEVLNYKFFCFNGEPRFLHTMKYEEGNTYHDYFNLNWERINYRQTGRPNAPDANYKCPERLDEMIEIAKVLSQGVPFLRVDLYNVGGKIYFGELTLYPSAGYMKWEDKDTDRELGALLELPSTI